MNNPLPQSFRSLTSNFGRSDPPMQEMINKVDMIDMRKMVDMIDMIDVGKIVDWLNEKVNLIVQVTHSIYAAFANFSAALQLLFILNFRLIITILDTIIGI